MLRAWVSVSSRPDGSPPANVGPGPFDPEVAVRRVCPISSFEVVAGSGQSDERRVAATNLTRLFMSTEILGACEHMMATAVTYAHDRVQFGQPIGTFQAVQHMLAAAEVQIRAVRSSIEMLVPRLDQLSGAATCRHLALLKALAGRTGHHVSQATLQVLGGIGFTEEHEHHRYAEKGPDAGRALREHGAIGPGNRKGSDARRN